ncbi:hypothetical protein B7P43_G11623 [Cryptotermes secundus]|uniref:Uncharacterized protein n=1 Tax=Cryptotermes secundus TaxID=105785 RepID=A0A2J7RGS9_9NEOP|nr:hypothetical protein B7P43_G11623 [Cryptotermes secundus]
MISSIEIFLHGCEIWSLTLREEHKLRVFEDRVLRIFGPKRDEVTGSWRKLYNEELHNLYASVGHVARMGETRNAYRILVGKPEGKRPLGRPRSRWVVNIKKDIRKIRWYDMVWIDLAQYRYQWRALVNTAMNLRVP